MHSPPNVSLFRTRVAIGAAFFMHGLCFSSWASRIPTVQHKLAISDTILGSLLFAIPLGSILMSFISARLIDHLGVRRALAIFLLLNSLTYVVVGFVITPLQLALALFLVGCLSNVINVSVNTQAVALENLMAKPIMASFHGLWSTAGFVGAALGSLMMGLDVPSGPHFLVVFGVIVIGLSLNGSSLLLNDPGEHAKTPVFVRPPRAVLGLGLIAFCSMICEGAMFDWSGVYFQNIIHAAPARVGLGYGAFMAAMATTRFVADRLTTRFGVRRILTCCGLMVTTGLTVAIAYPNIVTGVLGFLLVGAGTSAVVPLTISQAGKVPNLSPSAAIAATSTIGFIGFLIGPPLIGWIAGASSLRLSFLVVAVMGLGISVMGRRQFARV